MTASNVLDRSDDAALRECLVPSVEKAYGAPVVRLERTPLASSTSYDTSVVVAGMSDGRTAKIFLKDYGHSLRPKDEPKARRDREMRFYRDLATSGELGVPRYFGSVWDERLGRHWLLMEFVEGTPVRYCDFEYWVATSRWLGRMHGYFWQRRDRLETCEFLERLEAQLFRAEAAEAINAVTAFSTQLGERLAAALVDFESAIDAMLRPPFTLLHGGFHTLNVLTKIDGDPERMCVIDWEEAGIGSPLSDLSYLTQGFEGERLDQLLNAYRAEAAPSGLPLPDRGTMLHAMRCFCLEKRVASLPKYAGWDEPWKTLPKLVTHVEKCAAAVAAIA